MYQTCKYKTNVTVLKNIYITSFQNYNRSLFKIKNCSGSRQKRSYCMISPYSTLLNGSTKCREVSVIRVRDIQFRNISDDVNPPSGRTDSTVFTYISESTPVAYTRDLILSFHDVTGLPWWASIITLTFLLRACLTLPLAIYQNLIFAKVENLAALEMPEIANDVKRSTAIKAKQLNWTPKQASLNYKREVKKQWDTLVVRDNCHPFKATITLWVQIPTWICFSASLRNMAYMLPIKNAAAQIVFLQLGVGGLLWIPNLTLPDGTLVLPILLGLSNLAIIEIQAMMRLREPTRLQRYARNFFRTFSVILIPISATMPSSVVLYWTTSSVLGLGQNLLLMSNKFRAFCKIPDTPTTLDHPYLQLLAEIKEKGKFLQFTKK